jgi:hypothetical protein
MALDSGGVLSFGGVMHFFASGIRGAGALGRQWLRCRLLWWSPIAFLQVRLAFVKNFLQCDVQATPVIWMS